MDPDRSAAGRGGFYHPNHSLDFSQPNNQAPALINPHDQQFNWAEDNTLYTANTGFCTLTSSTLKS